MRPADLVALVADANMKGAMQGLLSRPSDLGIHSITHEVIVHPNRDPGCRMEGHELLRTLQREFRFALLMFDLEGSGVGNTDRGAVEADVERKLNVSGWKNRSAAIVIQPELEAWVWTDSPWVERLLGWERRDSSLRSWLTQQGFDFTETGKPTSPKPALEAALRLVRKPRSSSLYRDLARRVALDQCVDASFLKLRASLSGWFPVLTNEKRLDH